MSGAVFVVAIVELGDAAAAERFAKAQEAALLFRDLDSNRRFALTADVGTLHDMSQAIEVHVRPAVHGNEGLVPCLLTREILLDACHGQRTGRFDDRAIVFEDVLNRGADLVVADQDHLIDALLCKPKRLLAHAAHGNAIGKGADAIERDALAGLQRLVHRIGIFRLDADDADLRKQLLHVGADT